MTPPLVSLVIPFFNEEGGELRLFAKIDEALRPLTQFRFEIVCVNDGSTDQTLRRLMDRAKQRNDMVIVDLSRNFGKEAALSAGLSVAKGDAVVPMDADLQDPPELIGPMLEQWQAGFEVVLAKREDRSTDTVFKRTTARYFYKIHNLVADVSLPENVGDFRLMDRVVVRALNDLPENCRFMKGLFAWIGFRTTTVTYRRDERSAGDSSFKAWSLWNLALEGITSFSISPLKIWTYLGLVIALVAMMWGTWIVVRTLVWGIDLPGYASIFVAVLLLGGIQLIGIGMLGEYLGRTYLESKRRPPFVIRKIYDSND